MLLNLSGHMGAAKPVLSSPALSSGEKPADFRIVCSVQSWDNNHKKTRRTDENLQPASTFFPGHGATSSHAGYCTTACNCSENIRIKYAQKTLSPPAALKPRCSRAPSVTSPPYPLFYCIPLSEWYPQLHHGHQLTTFKMPGLDCWHPREARHHLLAPACPIMVLGLLGESTILAYTVM